ncbi:helix-turn-helix domain-containing protein [Burkholderia sp. AU31624]|uniref:helix-turn-helix domain-containing protein n=1 Tax=Burkholderia sp. AU31624 TaxID=2879629 RepID=UPI001CF20C75|nr:helix-turn-helix domain-containing protein [Burkholderia sp. AU31624]MCA8252862.1 helix-turn-helix domain-containing protein [Burkholderia sp. AU31624]
MSERTLQQRFSSDVGVMLKRGICRCRLHESIGWLAGGEPVDLAELAHARSGILIRLA